MLTTEMRTGMKLFQGSLGSRCISVRARTVRVAARLCLAAAVIAAPLPRATAGDWTGYMNVFNNDAGSQGGFVFGSAWGVADLQTTLIAAPGTGTMIDNNIMELFPNYNTYNAADRDLLGRRRGGPRATSGWRPTPSSKTPASPRKRHLQRPGRLLHALARLHRPGLHQGARSEQRIRHIVYFESVRTSPARPSAR